MVNTLSLCFCNKHYKYEACFTVDKSNVKVGETITFYNCSNYDSGFTKALWCFGDENHSFSKEHEKVQHSYNSPGNYKVILYIGEKENTSRQEKIITVS